ncbi:hypothetical protein [Halostella salina]|nr:hypothetical protein [Halostella salina]
MDLPTKLEYLLYLGAGLAFLAFVSVVVAGVDVSTVIPGFTV